jgi:predicted amino acid racemase
MARVNPLLSQQKVEVSIESMSGGAAIAEVSITIGSETETRRVTVGLQSSMTVDQIERAALREAEQELEQQAALLRSEISNRESNSSIIGGN